MLSRLASRAGLPRALVRPAARPAIASSSNHFHAGSKRQEAEKPASVSLDGPLIRYGLDDWKFSLPIGMALSVPFLANEWYVLSEETQLVACFVAFTATAYKHAGDAIAKSFDDEQAAIIGEINRLEELEVKLLKETVHAAEIEKTIIEDLKFLDAKSADVASKLEVALVGEAKAKIREQYVSWLNSVVATEKSSKRAAIDDFLNQTASQVLKNFQTDAKLKKAAVDQVITLLKDPKAQLSDLVGQEFEKVGKTVWDGTVKKASSPGKDSLTTIINDLKAIKAKSEPTEADLDASVKLYYAAFKAGAKPAQLKL